MLEITAKIKKFGAISENREQTIELSEVVVIQGNFCEGESRSIIFLTPNEQNNIKWCLEREKNRLTPSKFFTLNVIIKYYPDTTLEQLAAIDPFTPKDMIKKILDNLIRKEYLIIEDGKYKPI